MSGVFAKATRRNIPAGTIVKRVIKDATAGQAPSGHVLSKMLMGLYAMAATTCATRPAIPIQPAKMMLT
jgi:hypothetical protein